MRSKITILLNYGVFDTFAVSIKYFSDEKKE